MIIAEVLHLPKVLDEIQIDLAPLSASCSYWMSIHL